LGTKLEKQVQGENKGKNGSRGQIVENLLGLDWRQTNGLEVSNRQNRVGGTEISLTILFNGIALSPTDGYSETPVAI